MKASANCQEDLHRDNHCLLSSWQEVMLFIILCIHTQEPCCMCGGRSVEIDLSHLVLSFHCVSSWDWPQDVLREEPILDQEESYKPVVTHLPSDYSHIDVGKWQHLQMVSLQRQKIYKQNLTKEGRGRPDT